MSSTSETTKGKAPVDPAPATTSTASTSKKTKMKKNVRMTQEQIESYIRYKPVYMPLDALPRVTEERLALAKLSDHSHLTVPMDKVDDYIANLLREINREEDKFMKERERILNDYYAKGYAEVEVTDGEGEGSAAVAPTTGRRRFRPGVTKQAGQTRKLN
ncbi:unnamed protein product [Urochloa humidicola]